MTALPTSTSASARRLRHGFTVTELLVVIAIIAVLVGLLFAALNAANQRAKVSSTEATMNAFRAGCEAFQSANRQLPGVIPEDVLIADAVANNGGIPQLSSMENALLHLMGGYALSVNDPTGDGFYQGFDPSRPGVRQFVLEGPADTYYLRVDVSRIGEGPRLDGKQVESYFTPSPGTLLAAEGQVGDVDVDADEPRLPELVDAWGQPIAFMRRSRPLGQLVRDPGSNTVAQFDPTGLLPYVDSTGLGRLAKNQTAGDERSVITDMASDAVALDNLARVIRNPAFADEARGTFVLMSSGGDGIFFSAVDGPGTPTDPIVDLTGDDLPTDIVSEYDDILVFGGA